MESGLRIGDPVATRRRLREAMERRDRDAAVATFAPDIVVRSPIVGRPAFEGRDAASALVAAVIATFGDFRYTAEADGGDAQVLAFHARVRGVDIDGVDVLRIDEAGLITEFVVHIRPMAGLAAVAAALGPDLARGRAQRLLVTAFTVPLTWLLRIAEPIVPRLIRMR